MKQSAAVLNGKTGSDERVKEVISLADTLNLLYDKATMFKYPPKLKVWFGARDSVDNPFDGRQFVQDRVPSGQGSQRHQHTFPTTLDLCKLNHQSVRSDMKRSEQYR